jgi:hypothetical protein
MDYNQLAATAARLIAKFGQHVTFERNSRSSGNPSQPWRGPGAITPLTLPLIAAVIPNDQLDDPEAMRRGDATAYVAAGGSNPILFTDGSKLSDADNMTDVEGVIWHVHGAEIINPGGIRVFYQCTLAH